MIQNLEGKFLRRVEVIVAAKGGLNLECDFQHALVGVMTRSDHNAFLRYTPMSNRSQKIILLILRQYDRTRFV